jgi:hypothetical protein
MKLASVAKHDGYSEGHAANDWDTDVAFLMLGYIQLQSAQQHW